LHATFGIAKSGQAGLVRRQQQKIIAELVVQKIRGIRTLGMDHAKVGQGASALGVEGEVWKVGKSIHASIIMAASLVTAGAAMKWFWRSLWLTLGMVLVITVAAAWWIFRPLPMATQTVDLSISSGSTPRMVANQINESGIDASPTLLYYLFRFSGQSRLIRAGSYEIANTTNAWDLLQKLVRGEENLKAITLVEGWNLRQWRQALAKADFLKHDTQSDTDEELMRRLGRPDLPAEGRFFPDTYMYGKGSSDVAVLRRAMNAMDSQLSKAWAQRDMGLPLQNPQEALVLASIVEKETGKPSDRAMIASVFHNRLRINMILQTDPTVIYGLGADFDGNLRRADLQTDHPWNTYVHKGLPPTPIAMPGKAALLATLQPATSKALYFVSRGDGSSEFSESLDQHNAAVDRYQRKLSKAQ